MVLGPRSRGLVGAAELARMKKGAILVNTSRGPIVDEKALVAALRESRIFAALDVYDTEPLSPDNPFRDLPNTVLTPHLGFTTVEGLGDFYSRAIGNIVAYLDGQPKNVANPEALRNG
jgi:phosphoglycerate dehydrogenase-like enzyme